MDGIWIARAGCEKCKVVFKDYNSSETTTGVDLGKRVKYENDVFNLDITADQISEKLSIESTYNITYPVNVADKFVDVLNLANDGIFGLGTDESSVVYQLYNQSIISQPIYSLSFLNEPLLVLDKPDFLELSLVIETQQTI